MYDNAGGDWNGPYIDLGANFSSDPMFVDESSGDYHLDSTSPAIGAADAGITPVPGKNLLDRDPRPNRGVDIGCDEYVP